MRSRREHAIRFHEQECADVSQLEKPYPNQTFTVVIFQEDREKFGKPEETYRDQELCVSGKIAEYQGKPQIVAREPKQITDGGKR